VRVTEVETLFLIHLTYNGQFPQGKLPPLSTVQLRTHSQPMLLLRQSLIDNFDFGKPRALGDWRQIGKLSMPRGI
jgi:hypothetical protein